MKECLVFFALLCSYVMYMYMSAGDVMTKITYTYFRENMSLVLDDLRSGKSIVVTQRNKPDLVLSGHADTSGTGDEKTPLSEGEKGVVMVMPQNFVDVVTQLSQQLNQLTKRPEITQIVKKRNEVIGVLDQKIRTFEQALRITNERHADVIKELEDK